MNETVKMIPVRSETFEELELGAELTGVSMEELSEATFANALNRTIMLKLIKLELAGKLYPPRARLLVLKLWRLRKARLLREEQRPETEVEGVLSKILNKIIADAERKAAE